MAAVVDPLVCPRCHGPLHMSVADCPAVKRVEYHEDGTVKAVEYFEAGESRPRTTWAPATALEWTWKS